MTHGLNFIFIQKKNKLIKIEKINNLLLSNEFEINSKYLNNTEDYGSFYIFHYSKDLMNLKNQDIISNRCYLGYSQNNNLYTFVHGNTFAKFTSINSNGEILTNIVKTSLFKIKNTQFKNILEILIKTNYFL